MNTNSFIILLVLFGVQNLFSQTDTLIIHPKLNDEVIFDLVEGHPDSLYIIQTGSEFKRKGLSFGLCDQYKNIIIEPKFASIDYLGHQLFSVEKRSRYPKKSTYCRSCYDYDTDKFHIINSEGKQISNQVYNQVRNGYKDSSDIIYVNTSYSFVFPNKGNRGVWGAIDLKGNIIIPIKYSTLSPMSPDFIYAIEDMKNEVGYLNSKNEIIQEFEFERLEPSKYGFHNNLTIIKKEGLGYGFMNRKGEIIVEPQFFDIEPFKFGKAIGYREKDFRNFKFNSCIIDTNGLIIKDSIPYLLTSEPYGFFSATIGGKTVMENQTIIFNQNGEELFHITKRIGEPILYFSSMFFNKNAAVVDISGKGDMRFKLDHKGNKKVLKCPSDYDCESVWKYLIPKK